MAATAEAQPTSNDQTQQGIKRVINGAVDQVQTRLKEVEKAVSGVVEQLQVRLKEAGEDVEKRFEALKGSFKRAASEGEDADGEAQLGQLEQLVEKLGLAKIVDVDGVKSAVDKLSGRFETLKKKVADAVDKADFKKLVDRVSKLEKAIAKGAAAE